MASKKQTSKRPAPVIAKAGFKKSRYGKGGKIK